MKRKYAEMLTLKQLAAVRFKEGHDEYGNFLGCYDEYLDLIDELLSEIGDGANYPWMAETVAKFGETSAEELELLAEIRETVEYHLDIMFKRIREPIASLHKIRER